MKPHIIRDGRLSHDRFETVHEAEWIGGPEACAVWGESALLIRSQQREIWAWHLFFLEQAQKARTDMIAEYLVQKT